MIRSKVGQFDSTDDTGALFYQFIYSENLFFLLIMALWWAMLRQHPFWVFTIAFLLPLTRGIGVFCFLPLLSHFIISPLIRTASKTRQLRIHTSRVSSGFLIINRILQPRRLFRHLKGPLKLRCCLVSAPLIGWSLYLAVMFWSTGTPFAGFYAQEHWGAHKVSNLWNVPKFCAAFFSPDTWHEFSGSLLDRVWFLLASYIAFTVWRLDKAMMVWLYVLTLLPAMSGTFVSFTRFVAISFPLFIGIGYLLSQLHQIWIRVSLLLALGMTHAWLVWRHVNFRWAG